MRAFIEVYKMRPHEGLAFYTPFDVFHGNVDEVMGRRQSALDTYYNAHPERFPRGRPMAARPPELVTINPDDSAIETAAQLLQRERPGVISRPEAVAC
ncbi:hypothetical protein [Halorhodospira halochloris]|uniref:hypothetical protein n=1 Tax=Halorhodospira halochloris TaxID=1052 RepID=UPI001EE99259|nr:hypothetical protein [Halorhodospira halochloris]MCG5548941.1 hypothetical protein [Halorhodospira halochloris]